jgi:L-seryl-tRNA(Ser) seleniumtransferase
MQRVLAGEGAAALRAVLGDEGLRAEARAQLDSLRKSLLDGTTTGDRDALAQALDAALAERARVASQRNLRRIINATGVILHTNLGRAPLGDGVLDDVRDACRGYAALEYDLREGGRGHRDSVVRGLLVALTGAEDAIVVNNCAAAVLLACTALAAGREVIVSRGELVEIGGGFRVRT